jgi:hypothetical protein
VLVHSSLLRAPKVEVFKKKERHENIEEGGALSKRLVSQVDN